MDFVYMVRKKHQKMSMRQNSYSFLPLKSVLNILFLSGFVSFFLFFIQKAITVCVNEHVVQIP